MKCGGKIDATLLEWVELINMVQRHKTIKRELRENILSFMRKLRFIVAICSIAVI